MVRASQCVLIFTVATCLAVDPARASSLERAEELIDRFSTEHPDRIMVIGLLSEGERKFFAAGHLSQGSTADERTVFEIGSISKTFTGTMLAGAVRRGQLQLDSTVGEFVGDGVKLDPSVANITLEQLATHTSGLPRIARSRHLKAIFSMTPYGGSRETLDWDLSLLTVEPSDHPDYSNLGVGLLGDILSRVEQESFETILHRRIAEPLKLDDTVVRLNEDQKVRFAPGFYGASKAKPWNDMGTAVAAGGIRSTAFDLLQYAEAVIALPDGALGPDFAEAIRPRVEYEDKDWDVGLCWHAHHVDQDKPRSVPATVFHTGSTYSHTSALFVAPNRGQAVVVLINGAMDKSLPRPGQVAEDLLELLDD